MQLKSMKRISWNSLGQAPLGLVFFVLKSEEIGYNQSIKEIEG